MERLRLQLKALADVSFKNILILKTHTKMMFLVVEPLCEVKPPEPQTNKQKPFFIIKGKMERKKYRTTV